MDSLSIAFAAMGQLSVVYGTVEVALDGNYSLTIDPRWHEFADDEYTDSVKVDADVYDPDGIFILNAMISPPTIDRSFTGHLDGINPGCIISINVSTTDVAEAPNIIITDEVASALDDNSILVSWKSAGATSFGIEATVDDGVTFTQIGTVTATPGVDQYSFSTTAYDPSVDPVMFRIFGINFGKTEPSSVQSVTANQSITVFRCYSVNSNTARIQINTRLPFKSIQLTADDITVTGTYTSGFNSRSYIVTDLVTDHSYTFKAYVTNMNNSVTASVQQSVTPSSTPKIELQGFLNILGTDTFVGNVHVEGPFNWVKIAEGSTSMWSQYTYPTDSNFAYPERISGEGDGTKFIVPFTDKSICVNMHSNMYYITAQFMDQNGDKYYAQVTAIKGNYN